MSSTGRLPRFLMNGINMANNFCGKPVIQTSVYGIIEVGIKAAPMYLILKYASLGVPGPARGLNMGFPADLNEVPTAAPERRTSLQL